MFRRVVVSLLNVRVRSILYNTQRFTHKRSLFDIPPEVLEKARIDSPIDIPNPYNKPKPKCFLCKYKISVNYKNVRLLTQFISPYTGNIYGRHVTGLCERQQKIVECAITRARHCALMGYYHRAPEYNKDVILFSLDNPKIRNIF